MPMWQLLVRYKKFRVINVLPRRDSSKTAENCPVLLMSSGIL